MLAFRIARRFAPNATIKSLKSRDEVMLEMSSGRVDCVVNALVLGLTAIAKNPNLGSYKILQSPAVAIPSGNCNVVRPAMSARRSGMVNSTPITPPSPAMMPTMR